MSRGFGTLFLPHFGAIAAARHRGMTDDEELIVYDGTSIASGSLSLLQRGLIIGDTLHRARALFPHVRLVHRESNVEEAQWEHVLQRFYRLTPQIQPLSDPHLMGRWLHIQGFTHANLVEQLKALPAAAGYAASPTMSMIAAATATTGQLHIVGRSEEAHMLGEAEVRTLACFGFDPALIDLLADVGLGTLDQVQQLSLRQLRAQFQKEGERLHTLLHPAVTSPLLGYWDPRSVSVEQPIEWSVSRTQQLRALANRAACAALRQTPGCPRALALAARYRTGTHEAARHLKGPTRDPRHLTDAALRLFEESPHRADDLLGFTLTLNRLCPNADVQSDLFARPQVEHLITAMERRFPGKLCKPVAAARAAFVPEDQYMLAPLEEN